MDGVPYGDYLTFCRGDLLGIIWAESRFDCSVRGDGDLSRGCLQIYAVAHPSITDAQAFDLRWSAAWTLHRMTVGYGWMPRTTNGKANRYAISKHNGSGLAAQAYAAKVVEKSNSFIELYGL
jgi:hypothetical protein